MPTVTDGAPAPTTDWDSILSEGVSSTGIDPNGSFEEPAPQPVASGSSEGADTPAAPLAPAPAPAGDDGVAKPAAVPAAPEPAAVPDAKPFTFSVQGQERTIQGWHHLPGEGVFVPDEQVPHLQLLMSRAEFLDGQHKELQRQVSDTEKVLAWTPPGAQAPVTGRAAVEALHASRAELLAEVQAYQSLLSNPENLRQILAVNEDGSLAWNDLATKNFMLELQQTKGRIAQAVSAHFATLGAPAPAAAASAPATFDAVKNAPAIVDHAISQAADGSTWKQHMTAEDKAWAQQLVPRYVKTATAADAQANPALRVGEPLLEPEFTDLLRDRAKLREGTAKAASTAATAAKHNAGMNNGRPSARPAARPPAAPPAPPTPTRRKGKAEAWDEILSEAMQDIQL